MKSGKNGFKFDEKSIKQAGWRIISSPAFNRHGELAFAQSSKKVDGTDEDNFRFQLPELDLSISGQYGSQVPESRRLNDDLSVEIVTRLVGR